MNRARVFQVGAGGREVKVRSSVVANAIHSGSKRCFEQPQWEQDSAQPRSLCDLASAANFGVDCSESCLTTY